MTTPTYLIAFCRVLIEDEDTKEFAHMTLEDIVRVETLGMGGFGRVELVKQVYIVKCYYNFIRFNLKRIILVHLL